MGCTSSASSASLLAASFAFGAAVAGASTALACLELRHSRDQAVSTPLVEPMCSDSTVEEVAVVEEV